VRTPVSQVDLVPTLLDLLGQPRPERVQGASLRPLLEGATNGGTTNGGTAQGMEVFDDAEVVVDPGATAEMGPDVPLLLGEMAALMAKLAPALERRAADLKGEGKPDTLVETLRKGAELMHDSGDMFLAWAQHYAELSDNTAS